MEKYRCLGCGSTVTVDNQNDAVEFWDAHRASCGASVEFELLDPSEAPTDDAL
jgi:hypothetical protein